VKEKFKNLKKKLKNDLRVWNKEVFGDIKEVNIR